MLEIFDCMNYIRKELIRLEPCQVYVRVRSYNLLEIEVYFPALDYHICHSYSIEELKTTVDQDLFTAMFIKKIGDSVKAFKVAQ